MGVFEHDSETGVYNAPILTFPVLDLSIAGITTTSTFDIPMFLTVYNPPTRSPKVNVLTTVPLMDTSSNLSYGGSTLSVGSQELPKMIMQGRMDTPTTDVGGYQLPAPIINDQRLMYAEIVAMFFEGRAGNWQRINPVSFRDPYGRVYNDPTIFDFTAQYVESVPGRATFNLQLIV